MRVSQEEKIKFIQLARSENVGPITFKSLLSNFKTVSEALEVLPDLAKAGGKKQQTKVYDRNLAEAEYEKTSKLGGDIIPIADDDYPEYLREINDAPPIITVLGNIGLLKKPMFAVVGSRHASINGANAARKIALDLSNNKITVVSGLALGIDGYAHEAALKGMGKTVAVLGSGADVIYPFEHKNLYEQIKKEGAVISENPLGEEPRKQNFPRRNRIISGLSKGVLVVEATENSGSLITARCAIEQNREIFAVPGFPFDPRCQGPNNLIRQGAVLVRDTKDILEELDTLFLQKSLLKENEEVKKDIKVPEINDKEIEELREKIMNLLSASEINVDDLIRECQKSPQAVSVALVELELAGKIKKSAGNRVSKIF